MKNPDEPDSGPVPNWMRLLVAQWRAVDQAGAYPGALSPLPRTPAPSMFPDAEPSSPESPPSSSSHS